MSEQHTPGKWGLYCTAKGLEILGRNDFVVVKTRGSVQRETDLEHACACVNACEGLNPEAIPELIEAGERMRSHMPNGVNLISGTPSEHNRYMAGRAWRDALAKARDGRP